MIAHRKTGLVFACVFSTTALAMDCDEQGLQDYKNGISEMVQAGNTLEDAGTNKALAVYKSEELRLSSLKGPQIPFDAETCSRIDSLVSDTKANAQYQAALKASMDSLSVFEGGSTEFYKFDETKTKASKGAAAYTLMGLLKTRGVAFPAPGDLGNTPKGHAGFVYVNRDIAPEAAQWLVPGSFGLFYFQSAQRAAEKAAIAQHQIKMAAARTWLEAAKPANKAETKE